MKINNNLSELENFLSLINDTRDIALTKEDIDVFLPQAIVDTTTFSKSDPNGKPLNYNTQITVAAKENSTKYIGEKTIQYRRINIVTQWNLLYNSKTIKYSDTDITELTDENIIAFISTKMSYLASSMRVTVEVDAENNKAATVTLVPKTNSLVYCEDILTLSLMPKEVPIRDIITTTELAGFDYDVIETIIVSGFEYSGPKG